MATTTAQARPPALPAPRSHGQSLARFADVVRSEFTKIRSVRSTYWTLLVVIVVTVGLAALFGWGTATHWDEMGPGGQANFDAAATSLAGLILSQLVIVVLGALTITSEYSTGMIRTSLTALPRRSLFYAAKALVFAVVALIIGLVASFAAFFVGQGLLASKHIDVTLAQPGVARAVIGGGLFLAACGLLAFGIGAVLRHTAGAITASIGLLFVLFILANFLPQSWQEHVDKWLPFNAGAQIWTVKPSAHMFSPWAGFAVFCGYAAIALIAGLIVFHRRDA